MTIILGIDANTSVLFSELQETSFWSSRARGKKCPSGDCEVCISFIRSQALLQAGAQFPLSSRSVLCFELTCLFVSLDLGLSEGKDHDLLPSWPLEQLCPLPRVLSLSPLPMFSSPVHFRNSLEHLLDVLQEAFPDLQRLMSLFDASNTSCTTFISPYCNFLAPCAPPRYLNPVYTSVIPPMISVSFHSYLLLLFAPGSPLSPGASVLAPKEMDAIGDRLPRN